MLKLNILFDNHYGSDKPVERKVGVEMKAKTIICNLILLVIILLLGAGLTYLHSTHMYNLLDNTGRTVKFAFLGCIMILLVRMIKPMVKYYAKPVKYIILCVTAVLIMLGFTLLNSWWHCIAYPLDISYTSILKMDMMYKTGHIVLRYVIIFACWILLFWLTESGLLKKAVDFARDKIEDLLAISEVVEEVSAEEVVQLMNTLSNAENDDYRIYKSEVDDMMVYTIEVDKD